MFVKEVLVNHNNHFLSLNIAFDIGGGMVWWYGIKQVQPSEQGLGWLYKNMVDFPKVRWYFWYGCRARGWGGP